MAKVIHLSVEVDGEPMVACSSRIKYRPDNTTDDVDQVTCKRCLKIIESLPEPDELEPETDGPTESDGQNEEPEEAKDVSDEGVEEPADIDIPESKDEAVIHLRTKRMGSGACVVACDNDIPYSPRITSRKPSRVTCPRCLLMLSTGITLINPRTNRPY